MFANKKGTKDVETITALKSFEATYKAACRYRGIVPHESLLKTLQQAQENSSTCNKIVLSGPNVDAAIFTALVECLASYTAVKSVCCYNCSIGDEGITAIAHLLRASASKWWRGCRLNTLELCADGRVLPLQSAAGAAGMTAQQASSTTVEVIPQLAATTGTLHEMAGERHVLSTTGATGAATMTTAGATVAIQWKASLVETAHMTQKNIPAHALKPDTTKAAVPSQSTPLNASNLADFLQQQCHLQPAEHPCTTPHSNETGHCSNCSYLVQHLSPGVCPAVPAHLQLAFATHLQLAQRSLQEQCGPLEHIRYRALPPRPTVQVSRWVLDTTLKGWKQRQQQETKRKVQQHIGVAAQDLPKSETFVKQHSQWSPADGPTVQVQKGILQQQQQCQCSTRLDLFQQQSSLASVNVTDPAAESVPRFSMHALQQLSLGLGVSGVSLTRLVLDHTLIGDSGMSTLAPGLSRCCSLKHLSVCYCGIGPAGMRDLASACTPACAGAASNICSSTAAASRLSIGISNNLVGETQKGSGALNLDELLLNGNPLCADGLQHLSTALRVMSSLRVLGLADVCVGEVDKVQLQGLVYALTVGPTKLEQLDFDANYIGDRAALHFLTLLPGKPSLLMLKLTARVSPEIVKQLMDLLQQNLRTAQPRTRK